MASAVTLFNSSAIGSTAGQVYGWVGGRSAIVLSASQYGGGVFLQTQSQTGRWVPVNGTTYSADQVTAYDLPAGQYRMISNAGSSVALSATLVTVPYGV